MFSGVSSGVSVERHALTASFDYRLSPTTTLGAGAGAGLGGLITVGTQQRFKVQPGWELTGSWSRRLLDGRGSAPFMLLGVSGGASGAATREEVAGPSPHPSSAALYAFDIRAGLTVGKTFFDRLSPYAVVRVFGGPILWNYGGKTQIGSDLYHFQLGVGLVTLLPRNVDVFVEGIPGGERALTLGAGKTF